MRNLLYTNFLSPLAASFFNVAFCTASASRPGACFLLVCACFFGSPVALAQLPAESGQGPLDRLDLISHSIEQLHHPSYAIRSENAKRLQQVGWEAADQLLAAKTTSGKLEQRQSISRLLQQLPSLHLVITSLHSECPEEILQRMRDFQSLPFSNKAAVVRFLGQRPETMSRRLTLYVISRFDSDPLVRDFAAVTLLDDLFPIHDVKAYSDNFSPVLLQIPNRSALADQPDKGGLVLATPDWMEWVLGQAQLQYVSPSRYRLVRCLSNAKGELQSQDLSAQATLLKSCLRNRSTENSVLDRSTLSQIVARTEAAVAFPISAASPQRFDLHYEVLVRTARWALIQSRHIPELDDDYRRLVDNLHCLGNDPECFRPNADIFCEVAVIMQQAQWLKQWREGCADNSLTTNPTSTLSLSEAAYKLNCRQQAEQWLEEDFMGSRSRFSALQYAVLGKELGYTDCYRFLLRRVASQPINGNPASVTARLLNAESFAEDCDYANAAQQLSWLLNALHDDPALAAKVEKRLPRGLDEVRVRYHYFRAQDAADHWDWTAAIGHLSIGHSLDPYNTNLLTLAWKLEPHLPKSDARIRWAPVTERLEFVQRQSVQKHWTEQVENNHADRHSDFPLPQSLSSSGFDDWSGGLFASALGGQQNEAFSIQLSALHGSYLREQTFAALEHFESQIHQHQFQLNGGGKPAAQQLAIRKLSSNLNRWAYLADASQTDSELAYSRARRATKLVNNCSAYFDTLARCCQNSGRLDEAIDATRTAMALAPHDPSIRTRLATLQSFAQSDLR